MSTPTPHRERLELLVTMLEEVAAGTWNQHHHAPWLEGRSPTARAILEAQEAPAFNLNHWMIGLATLGVEACGFAACAVGHACLDERFQALGLVAQDFWPFAPTYQNEDGGKETDWDAVEAFFGLTMSQAGWLFDPSTYPKEERTNPLKVQERIRALLEDPQAVPRPVHRYYADEGIE